MNRPCLPGAFSFYHTIKLNAKESNVVKEKLKYPIPRLPPLCKHLLDDFGNVTAGKKAEPFSTAPLQPVDEKELKGWHELLFSGMD